MLSKLLLRDDIIACIDDSRRIITWTLGSVIDDSAANWLANTGIAITTDASVCKCGDVIID